MHAINPARVDFVTLRLFCAVAQSGSITKGAASCHLATSAASRRLSDFESATGARLLDRTSHGVALTPAGHVALQHATRLYQGFVHFGGELKDHSRGTRGHVRLWANMSSLTEFLPQLLSRFLSDFPDIRVEVEEQNSGDIVRALVDGLADIGVFTGDTPGHGLRLHRIRSDRLVVLCGRRHPLARRRRVDFAACLDHDFVGLNRGSSLLDTTLRAAQEAGARLRMRVQVRSFDALCRMIAAGLGIGIAPMQACQAQADMLGLRMLPLSDAWAERHFVAATNGLGPPATAVSALLQRLLDA